MGRRVRTGQTNFVAGALSPLMRSRYDNANFQNGAQQLKNFAPLAQGGVRTRPGLVYLASLAQNEGVLESFVFDSTQRYAFIFSNTTLHVYSAPDYALVATLTSAPWTTAMLPRLTVTQSGDTLLVFHQDMETQVVTRTGATSFTRAAFAFEDNEAGTVKYQPYYKYAPADMTLTPGATTGTGVSLTLSSPGAWVAAHVGSIVRYKGKEIEITGHTSATVATGTVRQTLADTTGSTNWDEATFSDARGWPNSGEFHEDRLWFLGSKSRRTGRWFSKIGAYFNFDLGTVQDNEASWESINDAKITEGLYAVSFRHLLMFADAGVYYQPATPTNPITPDSASSPRQGSTGSASFKPFIYNDAVIYAAEKGRTLYEARYNDIDQAYKPRPISLLAPHLIDSPTDGSALLDSSDRTEQYGVLVNGDGNLTIIHGITDENILAMVPWETAGTFKAVRAVGEDLLCIVARELDGNTVWTLEKFDDAAAPLDCGKTATNGSPTKAFSGFTHLANETVEVWSNGHRLGGFDVDGSGNLTLGDLDPELMEIEAGFAFTQTIQPMPAVFDLSGPTRGRVMGLVSMALEVDRSGSFTVNGNVIRLDFAGDDYTSAAPVKTGSIKIFTLGYDSDAAPVIDITTPVKVTILGLTREVEVNE